MNSAQRWRIFWTQRVTVDGNIVEKSKSGLFVLSEMSNKSVLSCDPYPKRKGNVLLYSRRSKHPWVTKVGAAAHTAVPCARAASAASQSSLRGS